MAALDSEYSVSELDDIKYDCSNVKIEPQDLVQTVMDSEETNETDLKCNMMKQDEIDTKEGDNFSPFEFHNLKKEPEEEAICEETALENFHSPDSTYSAYPDQSEIPRNICGEDKSESDGNAQMQEQTDFMICNVCGTTSLRKHSDNITDDNLYSYSEGVNEFYQCDQCGNSFTDEGILNGHKDIDNIDKRHQCTECGKFFTQKRSLKSHMNIHTGNKPYQCNNCGMSFMRKSNLNQHMNVHTGLKPHKCNYCGKSFSHKSNLHLHMNIHTGYKPYSCIYCGKLFDKKSHLEDHVSTHTGYKRYQCNECGKSFIRKSNLTEHMNIHTGNKPYQCSICSKTFNHKSNLNHHINKHTGNTSKVSR